MELFDDVIVGEFHLCRYMNSLAAALCVDTMITESRTVYTRQRFDMNLIMQATSLYNSMYTPLRASGFRKTAPSAIASVYRLVGQIGRGG